MLAGIRVHHVILVSFESLKETPPRRQFKEEEEEEEEEESRRRRRTEEAAGEVAILVNLPQQEYIEARTSLSRVISMGIGAARY